MWTAAASEARRRYPGGDLRELKAKLSTGEIAVNHQLHAGGGKIYLAQEFGPTALLEWNATRREAALLTGNGHGGYEGRSAGPDGLNLFLRSNSERPAAIEFRLMRGAALIKAGSLGLGESLALPGGANLKLLGTPMWARLHGSRDSALWLAYLGMILTMAGATLIFTLVKLDFCVVTTPLGDREKVFIALKPQRFAPLFQERFEKLVREENEFGLRRQSAAATVLLHSAQGRRTDSKSASRSACRRSPKRLRAHEANLSV